ncbi:MAG: hypothetical protein IKL10_09025 [Clostridia bacterium]|nr:hypothetical protein [Clostridia bacterium]
MFNLILNENKKLIKNRIVQGIIFLYCVLFIYFAVDIIFLTHMGYDKKDGEQKIYTGLEAIEWEKEQCKAFDGKIVNADFLAEAEKMFGFDYIVCHAEIYFIYNSFIDRTPFGTVYDPVSGTATIGEVIEGFKEIEDVIPAASSPALYRYSGAYEALFQKLGFVGILSVVSALIISALVFSQEYTLDTDVLLLTSKFGRRRLAIAKSISGISVSVGLFLLFTLISALLCFACYGFSGADGDIRLSLIRNCNHKVLENLSIFGNSVSNIEFLGFAFLVFFSAVLIVSSITLLISALSYGSFSALSISAGVFILPFAVRAIINTYEYITAFSKLHSIFALFPVILIADWNKNLWWEINYEIYGKLYPYAVIFPIIALIFTALFFFCSIFVYSKRKLKS